MIWTHMEQNMGQTTVFGYVRNRWLDSGSTTLRGRPDLPGALPPSPQGRRYLRCETFITQRVVPFVARRISSARDLAPIHNGTARGKPFVCQ
jgi:hypothetical protein